MLRLELVSGLLGRQEKALSRQYFADGDVMKRHVFLAALISFSASALAEAGSHKWLKIGQDVQAGKTFDVCVDQNGVQRNANGRVQYLYSFVCPEPGKDLDDFLISAGEVDCSQNLSGKTLKTKTWPYRQDGAYPWDRAKEAESVSISIASRSAIWVCRTQKR